MSNEIYEKPVCNLIGTDGNVFALASKVVICLERAGFPEKAKEVQSRLFECKSYGEALCLFAEYVDIE
jgi:hypothetical protein